MMRLESFLLEPPPREDAEPDGSDDNGSLPEACPEVGEETPSPVDAALTAERERLAAAVAEQEQLVGDLLSLREAFGAKAEAILDRWSRALAEGARAALPSVVSEGAVAEIAGAARAIAGAGPSTTITIRIAPLRRKALAALLEPPSAGVELLADPALADGRAALEWEDGGATIDAERLARTALDILNHHLESARSKEIPDDRY